MGAGLKLSVAEYDAMVTKGAFDHLTQKIELINGEIQARDPAGLIHDDYIQYLTTWSVRNADPLEAQVRIQSGLSFPELKNRPEPDVAWVKARRCLDAHPTGTDVLLLIEVRHNTLESDQLDNESLYAKAGIVEYWIVDILNEHIHVHREPHNGTYASVNVFKPGQSLAPLVRPDADLNLTDLFGKS